MIAHSGQCPTHPNLRAIPAGHARQLRWTVTAVITVLYVIANARKADSHCALNSAIACSRHAVCSKEKDRCCHKQRSLPEQVKRWGRGGGNALKLLAYILRAPIRRGFELDQTAVYSATDAEL